MRPEEPGRISSESPETAGTLAIHPINTPVIEVAGDGKTAKARLDRERAIMPRRMIKPERGSALGMGPVWCGFHKRGWEMEILAFSYLPSFLDAVGMINGITSFLNPMNR